MANKIQIRRGTKAKLPALSAGEIGLCTDTNEVYIGNGGNIRVNNKKTATKIIGNSSAGYNSGDVDYLVSGTSNAATIIQNAINALPSNGGKIIFLDGSYTVSSALTINKNVVFEGMGDGTQFNVSGSLAACSSAVSVVFRDMKIIANTISKYLYKGGGSDNVLLDNVTLTMTATGVHNLSTSDTKAAFLNVGTFTAVNSRISVKATSSIHSSGTGCFAVAELADTTMAASSVNVSDSTIELNGQYGRIHLARQYMNVTGCNIFLTGSGFSDTDLGIVGGIGCVISGSFISCEGQFGQTSTAPFVGAMISSSRLYSSSADNRYNAGEAKLFGCYYHNVTVGNSNSTYCTSY